MSYCVCQIEIRYPRAVALKVWLPGLAVATLAGECKKCKFLLEMQVLGFHPRPIASETILTSPPSS